MDNRVKIENKIKVVGKIELQPKKRKNNIHWIITKNGITHGKPFKDKNKAIQTLRTLRLFDKVNDYRLNDSKRSKA